MGLTVLAAGGSLPEVFSSFIMARKGELYFHYVRLYICYIGDRGLLFYCNSIL
jgi:Ca2+/Na+ antiporter